jgi:hypothetical protein
MTQTSSYCSLMHEKVLRDQFGEPVADIVRDRRTAPLDAVDVASWISPSGSSKTPPRSATPT